LRLPFGAEANKERRFLNRRGDLPPSQGYVAPGEIALPSMPKRSFG